MENNERDRKLDQWLDEALSQYGAAEPRLGLEHRVLAHVRAEEQAREGRRSWWRWMPAFAAIAAVLVVMVAVKPYWAEKSSITATRDSGGLEKKQRQETKSDAISAGIEATDEAQSPSRITKKLQAAEANETLRAKQKSSVQMADDSSHPARVAKDKAVTKEAEQTLVAKQEELLKQTDTREEMRLHPSGAGTGVSGGVMPSAKVAAMPHPATSPIRSNAPQMQTLQVQSAAAPVPMQRGVMAPDQLSAQAEGSAQVRSVQVKPAMNATVMGNTMEVMGVTLRTDAITVQPRQVQQFPTPMPLSKQEKLMLAASKELKQTPATNDKKENEISPIEIKKIEIEPLPGPEK